ncbi:hypothetical protein [Anabaena azotica]|uniref:hypothetical protein n=1 Tax=Anabaena azotica TaxID=197653 RepID=UPI0039A54DD3
MKTYQELKIQTQKMSDTEFIDVIKNFTQKGNDWTYLQQESEEHINERSTPSFILFLEDGYHLPTFLITKRKIVNKNNQKDDKSYYYIGNIFNSQHGNI